MASPNTIMIVWCTFDIVGFHCWPKAPELVSYLRKIHRHVFKFKVGVRVTALNRQVEFHTLRANARERILKCFENLGYIELDAVNFGNNSCEMIAKIASEAVTSDYTSSIYELAFIEVSEDGENGATLQFS